MNKFNKMNTTKKNEPVLLNNFENIPITNASSPDVYIGLGTVMRGHLDAPGEVVVNGTFEGTLKASQLIIGKNGYVNGSSIADTVIVYGKIDQELISTTYLHVCETGALTGNVSYFDIEIAKGGKLEGSLVHQNKVPKNTVDV